MESLFWLLCGHALADFALQTEWIAKNKSRHSGLPAGYNPRLHGPVQVIWPYALSAHALIHAGAVGLVLGWEWGAAEFVAHWAIDFWKCERAYGIHADQALHVFCKVAWLLGASL